RQARRAGSRSVPPGPEIRPRAGGGAVPAGHRARTGASLRRGGGSMGEGDAPRPRQPVRAASARARPHRARSPAHLRLGRGLMAIEGRLGEILVSLGAITPRELERQVRFQIEEVVFEMMSWREGYFSFTEGPLSDVPTDAMVRIPTEALLMEGARRIDEWSRIEGRIPH